MDDDFPYGPEEANAFMVELHQEIFDTCSRFLERTGCEPGVVPASLIDAAVSACAAYCVGDGNNHDEGRRIVMDQLQRWQAHADFGGDHSTTH